MRVNASATQKDTTVVTSKVAALMDVANMTPLLHISSRYPASRHCAALVAPVARHPRIDSHVVVCSLESDEDIDALLAMAPDEIADRLYTPKADLPEGEERARLAGPDRDPAAEGPVLLWLLEGQSVGPFPKSFQALSNGFIPDLFGVGKPSVTSLAAGIISVAVLVWMGV